jgi:predicted CoA-binding protein
MAQPSAGAGFTNPADTTIRDILASPRTIAVVGCSPDPSRDSHQIAALLKARGHTIIPVNPHCREVLGEPCFPSLREVPTRIEMVDVFRRSRFVGQLAEEAIALGASILWLQLGVIDPVAAQRAQAAGLTVVMDRCPAIEYRRLF